MVTISMAVCSGGFSVHGENERRREKRWRWRGGMDRGELLGESRHEEVARGGSRHASAWRRRRHAGHAAAWLPVEEDKAGPGGLGRLGLAWGDRSGFPSPFIFLFLFSVVCFG